MDSEATLDVSARGDGSSDLLSLTAKTPSRPSTRGSKRGSVATLTKPSRTPIGATPRSTRRTSVMDNGSYTFLTEHAQKDYPKVLSMLAEKANKPGTDCWADQEKFVAAFAAVFAQP